MNKREEMKIIPVCFIEESEDQSCHYQEELLEIAGQGGKY
jgi:hypothetical protein